MSVSSRPLVFVSGLTLGDYLLWSWSLNHNHDVLALVSGLTLPPLAVAWAWLLILSLARMVARFVRPAVRNARLRRSRAQAPAAQPQTAAEAQRAGSATTVSGDAPSGKLAA